MKISELNDLEYRVNAIEADLLYLKLSMQLTQISLLLSLNPSVRKALNNGYCPK